MEKRDTVGKISTDILQSADYLDHSSFEQMQEQLMDYENQIVMCIERGKKYFPQSNFYVVVETKKEPLMHNVIRNYFFPRLSCPTPTYDNTVYKYHALDEELEFLWVLPSKATYDMMLQRPLEIPQDQKQLFQFVLDDHDGTLMKMCKKLNEEIN